MLGILEWMKWTRARVARSLPLSIKHLLALWLKSRVYRGDYLSWSEASLASDGYDSAIILQKAIDATRSVRDGHALWERDTVLFYEAFCYEPLLAALRQVAASENGRLSVVDFGGALGSTWWQHRPWLGDFTEVHWSVVEQPRFVVAGRREFTTGQLSFYETVDACFQQERPNVVLLSSVLPYLENPHALLADLAARECDWLIIDRTGFTPRGRDWLAVQHVPAEIYCATYPCWFFDQNRLLDPLLAEWRVMAEWPTFDGCGAGFEYRGLLLNRITSRRSSVELPL